jgi:hypothetical protein
MGARIDTKRATARLLISLDRPPTAARDSVHNQLVAGLSTSGPRDSWLRAGGGTSPRRSGERLELTLALIVLAAGGGGWGAFSAQMHIPLWAVALSAAILGALVGLRLAIESWLKRFTGYSTKSSLNGPLPNGLQSAVERSSVPAETSQRSSIRIRIKWQGWGNQWQEKSRRGGATMSELSPPEAAILEREFGTIHATARILST